MNLTVKLESIQQGPADKPTLVIGNIDTTLEDVSTDEIMEAMNELLTAMAMHHEATLKVEIDKYQTAIDTAEALFTKREV